MNRRDLMIAGTGVLAAASVSKTASAQTVRWQMAIGAPETNYLGKIVKDFVEEVGRETNGQFQITLHPRGSLLQQPQIMRGVRSNQVQLGKTLLALHGNEDPFFEVEGIPFLADTWEDTRRLQSAVEPFVRQKLNQRGVTLLFSIPWTSQGIYTNAPIRTVEDLRGKRLRIYNPVTNRMAALAGATPVSVVASEMPQAFAAGIINAMFTSAQTGVDFAAWDYTRVFTDVGGMRNRAVVIINNDALASLSQAHREVLTRAASRANARGFQDAMAVETSSVATLRSRGLQTPQAPAQLMTGLRSIGTQLIGEWITKAGPEGAQLIARYRELQRAGR